MPFLFWFVGIPAAILAAVLLVVSIEWLMSQAERATNRCQERLSSWRSQTGERSAREQDRAAFRSWLAAKTGTGQSTGAVDPSLIEAQRQSELIRVLIEEEVPKAVFRCVETHRLTARVTGAYQMFEIAYEPECYQLRAGIIWLLAHTVEFLEAYPLRLDDARLLNNSIILRKRALPICRRCPYIQLPVDQAPALCPTAELVQIRGISHETDR